MTPNDAICWSLAWLSFFFGDVGESHQEHKAHGIVRRLCDCGHIQETVV
jgi:hypothetical protein